MASREFNKRQKRMLVVGLLTPEASRDYSGYDFWLKKLNRFNGNFVDARDGQGVHNFDRVPATIHALMRVSEARP